MKLKNKHGFTLVELVIVIAAIAILAGVLVPTFSSVIEKAKESVLLQETRNEELEEMIDGIFSDKEENKIDSNAYWHGSFDGWDKADLSQNEPISSSLFQNAFREEMTPLYITLDKDNECDGTIDVPLGCYLYIDLNGHNLSLSSGNFMFSLLGGTLYIKNSKDEGGISLTNKCVIHCVGYCSIMIDHASVTTTKGINKYVVDFNYTQSTLILLNGADLGSNPYETQYASLVITYNK